MTTPTLERPVLTALIYAGAAEQARALAAGEVTSLELVEQSLARIDRYDGLINAIVVRDDDAAREAARAADAALARGERKPLLGVPITVKESFDVAGWPTTSGNADYRDNVAAQDSPAVAALREAGAVLLGKSNVPLALSDLQSYNVLHGVTNNPWDLTRTPGGSSGGSAAALAAGYVALEIGSDIGGSIRIPAHFTGVYGHKPSFGLVSMRGTSVPSGRISERDLSVGGPLARRAADLALALDLLLNRDPSLNKAWRATLPPARHTRLSDYRVLVLDQWPGQRRSRSERLVGERLTEWLGTQGSTIVDAQSLPAGLLPDLTVLHRTYRSLLNSSHIKPVTLSEAALRDLNALDPEDQSADAAWLRGPTILHSDWLKDSEVRYKLREQWERLFEYVDVVVSPVAPLPAFLHNHDEPKDSRVYPVDFDDGVHDVRFRDLFHWAGLPVLPGLPATAFPIGLDDNGLPLGAQVMGAFLEDKTTIAFAGLLEAAYGGFTPPPGY